MLPFMVAWVYGYLNINPTTATGLGLNGIIFRHEANLIENGPKISNKKIHFCLSPYSSPLF